GRALRYSRGTVSRLWFMTSGGAADRISSAHSWRPRKSGTRTSIVVAGEAARRARMQSTKCWAPPSRRSSRSTLVTTTYESPRRATVAARCAGSSASGARGRPCATSQKGQRRVQTSPRIMKVAVPLPKHSAMFGQEASSHTVCSFCSRRMDFTSWKRESGAAARTRIQGGFGSAARGTIFIGMRAVLAAPFSFAPGSRMLEPRRDALRQPLAHDLGALAKAELAQLRDPQAGIAAGRYCVERPQVHVHVERDAVVGAPACDPDAERRDLGRAAAAEKIEHCFLEKRDVRLHLDAAPREIDEGVDHRLPGAVVGHLAAAVAVHDRDRA